MRWIIVAILFMVLFGAGVIIGVAYGQEHKDE